MQSEGCAPIVRAFDAGRRARAVVEGTHTVAFGINVPKALGDFLILEAVRESGGTAIAVRTTRTSSPRSPPWRRRRARGCARRAPPAWRPPRAARVGWIGEAEQVVVLNTGTGLKYPDTVSVDVPTLARDGRAPGRR